jgi:microcystin-dependent protein
MITMKTKLKLTIAICFGTFITSLNAQVGVNIVTPHPSAAMQIETPAGLNKGLLTPSMTATQRAAVVSPADGLVVYDVTNRMHFMYEAASANWISMSPLRLKAPAAATNVTGIISTPTTASPTTFSLGINTQNPSQHLDVVGNATVSGNTAVGGNASVTGSLNVNGFSSNALVPTGGIIMWSGTTPPAGWGLCDGSTYTNVAVTVVSPDLRGRFVVGYSSTSPATPVTASANGTTLNYGAIGNNGGENGHLLTSPESGLPAHTHTSPPHSHQANGVYASGPGPTDVYAMGNAECCTNAATPLMTGVSVSINANVVQNASIVHENRPPYYVLAFIIKKP